MKYGLSETDFSLLCEKVVMPLKALGARVYLFGSRATGKSRKFSDVDLLYVQGTPQPISGNLIYNLLHEIEVSHFPYKVDLVCDAELAASYRSSVEREKIEL